MELIAVIILIREIDLLRTFADMSRTTNIYIGDFGGLCSGALYQTKTFQSLLQQNLNLSRLMVWN